jgi:hypothetical protein
MVMLASGKSSIQRTRISTCEAVAAKVTNHVPPRDGLTHAQVRRNTWPPSRNGNLASNHPSQSSDSPFVSAQHAVLCPTAESNLICHTSCQARIVSSPQCPKEASLKDKAYARRRQIASTASP